MTPGNVARRARSAPIGLHHTFGAAIYDFGYAPAARLAVSFLTQTSGRRGPSPNVPALLIRTRQGGAA